MNIDLACEQLFDLSEEMQSSVEVFFDSDKVTLEGIYTDELSAFRAKRVWTDVLESNFLLEKGDDFALSTAKESDYRKFLLICNFKTACGRYAFWRLVNNQAPESQYLIETAHIPDGLSNHTDLLRAPDLKPSIDCRTTPRQNRSRLMGWVAGLFRS